MTSTALPTTAAPISRIAGAAALAALLTAVVNVGIASAALALGAAQTPALTPPADITLSVVAGVVGAIGWALVRRRAADPRRVLVRLVPAVLLVSFVPDVVLAVLTAGQTGLAPILALVVMHVATITIAVAVYARLLPVHGSR
ncbi:DUF6069 family protein [Amnibacterium endophyticum]|uniref:DUF6069 family protein n=1 Tax=Amnibacterium endophyticum TaxID=2109337 RepID=A0ABW4L9P0_9MICO